MNSKSINIPKKLILLFCSISIFISCTHDPDPFEPEVKPDDNFIKKEACVYKDLIYACAPDTGLINQDLLLDIYLPAVDSASQKFPLVLLIHAGSYLHGSRLWTEPTARILQDSGFIVANIEYRLGWDVGDYSTPGRHSLPEAEYRGMQDANAALRFLVANSSNYRIDTSWIFVMGESAGASIALNSTFATEEAILYKSPEIVYKLGRLNQSGNPYINRYKIRGVCSKYGSISDSLFINRFNSLPVICFHGSNDNLVPVYTGLFLGNWESPAFGSAFIYERQLLINKVCEFHLKTGGTHMPPEFNPAFSTPIAINFFKKVIKNEVESLYFEH